MELVKKMLLVAGALCLAACNTLQTHHLYEGTEIEESGLVAVIKPQLIDVIKVDGKPPSTSGSPLVTSAQKLLLLPGDHTMEVRYSVIYEIDDDDFGAFRSHSVHLRFSGEAGTVYRLTYDEPSDEQLLKQEKDVDIRLEWVKSGDPQKDYAPVVVEKPATREKTRTDKSSLDQLKFWWGKADRKEKAAFQEWTGRGTKKK